MEDLRTKKLNGNIWKMAVLYVSNKRPYVTFLTIFLLTMPNATAQTIGLLTLVAQITGFLFEIPSGYLADKIGHKNALIICRIAMALSTLCYILANNISWFFLGAIFLAIGISFMSGTSSAFLHDTLSALNKENRYSEIMGKIRSIGFAVPIIFIILLPLIAEHSFRWAFGAMLVIDLVGLLSAVMLVTPTIKESNVKEVDLENLPNILKRFTTTKWTKYVILMSIVFGIYFGSVMGFKNPYQETLGFSLFILGVLWAFSRVLISTLLLLNGKIYKLFTFKQFIIVKNLIYALGFIIIGIISNMWVVAIIFIIMTTANFGLSAAENQYDLEFIRNERSKATLLSIKNFMNNIFSGLAGLGMGFLVFSTSYQSAYLVSGISLLVIAIIIPLLLIERKNREIINN